MTQIFFDGDGTAENPYQIDSVDDLEQFADEVNGGNDFDENFFVLTADIELIEEWTPICGYLVDCNTKKSFKGTFDGQGHTISNITVNNPSGDCQALFSCLGEGGKIKNLNLTNVAVSGRNFVGGLVGDNSLGKIENCTISNANINGQNSVGGLVGHSEGKVNNVTVSGNENVSGLVGCNFRRTIKNCKVGNVIVSGKQNVDEFVGFGDKDTIENCTVTKS